MKIQSKLTLVFGLVLTFSSLLFLTAGTIYALHEALLHDRAKLREAAKYVDVYLTKNGVGDQQLQTVRHGFQFVSHPVNLSYAVYRRNGTLVLKSKTPPLLGFPQTPEPKRHATVRSFALSATEWCVEYTYWGTNFVVVERHMSQIELHEDLAAFLLGAIGGVLLLSLVSAWLLARRLVSRITKISQVSAAVADGDLRKRIDLTHSADEVGQMEKDLNYAFSELKTAFEQAENFSSDAAHELRTPLTFIMGELEVCLRKVRTPEEYQDVIAQTHQELTSLHLLLEDLLLISKPFSLYDKSQFADVNLNNVIVHVIDQLSSLSKEKEIVVHFNFNSNISIAGNEAFLQRMCFNLLHNALKFSPPSSSIDIHLQGQNNAVELVFVDQGKGISKDLQPRMFERFHRTPEDKGGAGLGLAIVKWVAELHGGTIQVESTEGKGSKFTVRFPRR